MARIVTTYRTKDGRVIHPVLTSADGENRVEKGLELRIEVHPFYPCGNCHMTPKLSTYLERTRELITSYPGQMLIMEEGGKIHETLGRSCLIPKPTGPRFFIPTNDTDSTPKKPLTDETFADWVKFVFEPTKVIISGAYLTPIALFWDKDAGPDYQGYKLVGCVGGAYLMFKKHAPDIPRELDLQHCFPGLIEFCK